MTVSCIYILYLDHNHHGPLLSSAHLRHLLLSSTSAPPPFVGCFVFIWVLFGDRGFN